MVIIRGTKLGNNLYKLLENTILGGTTIFMEDETCKDETQLWHLRLGQMSERALKKLHR